MRINRVGAFLLALVILSLPGCSARREAMLQGLVGLEGTGVAVSEDRIRELEKTVADLESDVMDTLRNVQELGNYYKLLGNTYLGLEMFGKALESFKLAIEIYPQSAELYYYAGLCAGQMAETQVRDEDRLELIGQAAGYYEHTLTRMPGHVDAMRALAIAYTYELGRAQEAEPLVTALLAREPDNAELLFILANIQVQKGYADNALAIYDKILETTPETDVETRDFARANKETIRRAIY